MKNVEIPGVALMKRIDELIESHQSQTRKIAGQHISASHSSKKQKYSSANDKIRINFEIDNENDENSNAILTIRQKSSTFVDFVWKTKLEKCNDSDSTDKNILRDQLILPLMFVNASLEKRIQQLTRLLDKNSRKNKFLIIFKNF